VSTVAHTLRTLAWSGLVFLAQFGQSIAINRVLGPENKGIYAIALLLPMLLYLFLSFGMQLSTTYFAARSEQHPRTLLSTVLLLALLQGCLLFIFGQATLHFFGATLFPSTPLVYLRYALLLVFPTALNSIFQAFFKGRQMYATANRLRGLNAALKFAAIIALVVLAEQNIHGALTAMIFGGTTVSLLSAFAAWRKIGFAQPDLQRPLLRSFFSYGMRGHAGNIIQAVNLRADIFMLNLFLSPMEVGLYSVAATLSERLWMLPQAARSVLLPKLVADETPDGIRRYTPLVARTMLILATIIAFPLAVLAPQILALLYSEAFVPAALPLQLLLIGTVTGSGAKIFSSYIAAIGRPGLNSKIAFYMMVLNVSLNLLWIPRYGAAGAALASAISYSCNFCSRMWAYQRIAGTPWHQILWPTHLDWEVYRDTLARIRAKMTSK